MRKVLLLLLLSAVFSSLVVQDKVFVEKGETFYLNVKIIGEEESYELEVKNPYCVDYYDNKYKYIGYLGQGSEINLYLKFKNNCETIEKVELILRGTKETRREVLVIPFKEPEVKIIGDIFPGENDVKVKVNFTGDEVCLIGNFIGENKVCSKDGNFNLKIFANPGINTLNLLIEIKKNGLKYTLNKTITFYAREDRGFYFKEKELKEEGKIKFELCRNCLLCLYSTDVLFDKDCEKEFEYKVVTDEDKAKVFYVLLKERSGYWVPIENGTLVFKVKREKKDIQLKFWVEDGKINLYIVNPGKEPIKNVFLRINNSEKYYSSIEAEDYEVEKLNPGCYEVEVFYENKSVRKTFCYLPKRKISIWIFLLIILIVAFFLARRYL